MSPGSKFYYSLCNTKQKAVIPLCCLLSPCKRSIQIVPVILLWFLLFDDTRPQEQLNTTWRLAWGQAGRREVFCTVRRLSQPPPCSLAGWSTLTHSCCCCCYRLRGYTWAKSTAPIKREIRRKKNKTTSTDVCCKGWKKNRTGCVTCNSNQKGEAGYWLLWMGWKIETRSESGVLNVKCSLHQPCWCGSVLPLERQPKFKQVSKI